MKIIVNQLSFNSIQEFTAYLVKTHSSKLITTKKWLELEANLQIHSVLLEEIAALFAYPPYPDFEQFLLELRKNSRDLRTVITAFDKDPHAKRSDQDQQKIPLPKTREQILNEQFNTGDLKRVIRSTCKDTAHLSHKQQHDLAQQVVFINAIGKDFPLTISGQIYTNLTQITRKKLRECSDALIVQIRTPGLSSQSKLQAQLHLLAVVREQYFRATGVFVNSTQLLTILMAVQQQNLVIATHSPEEKKDTTALIAAMQWVMAEGDTVDVCAATSQQDFQENGAKDFFTSLGIASSCIANKEPYQAGGINYTTLRDLALYRSHTKNTNDLKSRHLILNESDFSNLDTKQLFTEGDDQKNHAMQSANLLSVKDLITLYQERGHIIALSDTLTNKKALSLQCAKFAMDLTYQLPSHLTKQIACPLSQIQNKQNEETAITRHFTQLVSGKQQVALQQFDEWQAFLHLIYPPTAWQELDKDLSSHRMLLQTLLEELWITCMEESDPQHIHANFYVRRDHHNKLQTHALNKAVKNYEQEIAAIWNLTQTLLEGKTHNRIIAGSINDLRYKYLKSVPFNDLLQLNKLEARHNRKEFIKQKKKNNRYLEFGLDVHGAMLKYATGDITEYKEPYAKIQRQLLANGIKQAINHSSLSKNIKVILRQRADQANNFLALELLLLDVQRWLGPDKLAEKYRFQPLIHDLLKIYKHASLTESNEVKLLKAAYLDNVTSELIQNLELSLSWASTKSLSYWLERGAVKNGASEILLAVTELKNASTVTARQMALQNLYQKLATHQARLADTWIFSLGHKNTRDLINETLIALDSVMLIGSGENKISATFIQESKETAYANVMKMLAQQAIEKFQRKNPWLNKYAQWNNIVAQLALIKNENSSVYAIDEMYYFLTKKRNELNHTDSKLYKQVMELRREVGSIGRKYYDQHKPLFDGSRHLDFKAAQLMARFKGLKKTVITKVMLKPVQTGFNHCFDLILEGSGSHPFLDGFVRYNSSFVELTKDRNDLIPLIKQTEARISLIERSQKEILPQLKNNRIIGVDLQLFPVQVHSKIQDILSIKAFAEGALPENLSIFPEAIRHHFLDRELLKNSNWDTLDIKQINNKQLQKDIHNLYKKLHAVPAKTSLFSSVANILFSGMRLQESEEDLHYQFAAIKMLADKNPADKDLLKDIDFTKLSKKEIKQINDKELQSQLFAFYKKLKGLKKDASSSWFANTVNSLFTANLKETDEDLHFQFAELKSRSHGHLQDFLSPKINEKIGVVNDELGVLKNEAAHELELLNEKLRFIDEKIRNEQQNSGLLVKRFESIEQLYDFEAELRNTTKDFVPEASKIKPLVVAAVGSQWDEEIESPHHAVVPA